MEQRKSAFEHYEHGLLLKQVQIFDSALKEFRQAATDPLFTGKAHVQMALCFKSTGCDEEAVTAFRQALESGPFSSKEQVHVLYLLGKTLESLGREVEALVVYRRIRREDPDFRDVDSRIQHLSSGGRGPVPSRQPSFQTWVENLLKLWGQPRPQLVSLLGQTWESLARYVETLETYRWVRSKCPSFRDVAYRIGHREFMPNRRSPLASTGRRVRLQRCKVDKRQDARVGVLLRSQFSSKIAMVAGEGKVRDLSRGGCRIMSPVPVPVGVELECCIFPQGDINPFTIEGATVRWSHSLEFGLAFTNVRPDVKRQIAQLCRTRMPLG